MELVEKLGHILFPPRCLGCGVLSSNLCFSCESEWSKQNLITALPETVVYSSRHYSNTAQHILLAAKEHGIEKAKSYIYSAINDSISHIPRLKMVRALLVPIPSQKSAIRKRGHNFLADIVATLGRENRKETADILIHRRSVLDQSRLPARERFENLSGALSTKTTLGRGELVILVDDLVTTGATLGEAVKTLEGAGFKVICAVTACVALPLR